MLLIAGQTAGPWTLMGGRGVLKAKKSKKKTRIFFSFFSTFLFPWATPGLELVVDKATVQGIGVYYETALLLHHF